MTPSEKQPPESSRARALIMTVGVPSDPKQDIAAALLDDIQALAPEALILLASKESNKNAIRLSGLAEKEGSPAKIIKLDSAHDVEEAFRRVNGAIDDLIAEGIGPEEIAINFTSGTKMMGSGAVLSAVFKRCMELRYLTGATSGSDRRRLIRTYPAAVFAYQDLLRGRRLTIELHFESALAVLASIDDSLLAESDRSFHSELTLIAEAYKLRQSFHPEAFRKIYGKAKFDSPLLESFKLDQAQVEATLLLEEEVRGGKAGMHAVVDLYDNGIRRLNSGAPDDAVIRLYRAMEMLAQWILLRDYEIDTNEVDTRRIPPRDRVPYEALRSIEDGMVKIGLRKAYDLLIIFEAEVGRRYQTSKTLRDFLSRRADSILAHGLTPISEDTARRLFEAGRELFLAEIDDFDAQCHLLQFPWLNAE